MHSEDVEEQNSVIASNLLNSRASCKKLLGGASVPPLKAVRLR